MRISDWSSDVCSYDLIRILRGQPPRTRVQGYGEDGRILPRHARHAAGEDARPARRTRPALLLRRRQWRQHRFLLVPERDRKSVVSGKSAVRVDAGGPRIIKKKTDD